MRLSLFLTQSIALILLASLTGTVLAKTEFSSERIRFSNREENVWVGLSGRIHYDITRVDDDVIPLDDDADFRRMRIALTLQARDFRLKADNDIGGITTGWKSLYLQYRGFDNSRITFGNHVAPFSLEDVIGSNNSPFLERSLANALSPGLLTGLSASHWSEHWSISGGYFGNELSDQDRRISKGRGSVARFTYAPIRKKRHVFHMALNAEYRSPDDRDELRLRSRPGTRLTDTRLVDTRTISDVDTTWTSGLEVAYMQGPFSAQAEFMNMIVQRNQGSDLEFKSGYVMVSYFLTGEFRPYSRRTGAFGSVEPENKPLGAIEVAARYGTLNLNDKDVRGGEENNFTLGVNWYINRNFRTMLNYVNYDASPNKNGQDDSGSMWLLRFQARI